VGEDIQTGEDSEEETGRVKTHVNFFEELGWKDPFSSQRSKRKISRKKKRSKAQSSLEVEEIELLYDSSSFRINEPPSLVFKPS
jgi:hypothetical protein